MDLLFQQEAHVCGSLGERSKIRQKTPEYQPPGSASRLSRPPSNQQLVRTKDDTRDDDTEGEALLPDKASTESKDSKVETLKQEAADNSNQKGNSVQQTVALKPIDPKMPTIKINLTKQTVSSAGKLAGV